MTRRPAPRRRWPGALVPGLVIAGLLAPIVRDEIDPPVLREAAAAYGRADLETALRRALDHLERRPSSRAAALSAARCLSRLDFADQAEPYYRRAGPLGHDDLHIRAYGLVRANRREEAVAAYEGILGRWPDDVLALRRLAAVRISQRRPDEALALADRLVRIPSGAVIGHTLAGVVHHSGENPERAVAAFGRVLALDPDLRLMPLSPRSMFWEYLARDLLALGRPAEARRHLLGALTGAPDATLAILLGRAYHQEGTLDEAERWWRRASEWDPKLVEPWLSLGRLMLQRDRPEEAIGALDRAAALAPAAYEPLYSLSLAHRRLGGSEEADRLRAEADRLRGRPGPPPRGMGTNPSPAP